MRLALATAVSLISIHCGFSQDSLVVSPSQLSYRVVVGGPFGGSARLSVQTAKKWTLQIPNSSPWLDFKPNSGTGSATLAPILVDWAAPKQAGSYSTTATIKTDDGVTKQVTVSLEVVPKGPAAKYTYLSGPKGCTQPPEYPDAALCEVPDEKPPGKFAPPATGKSYIDPTFGARVRMLAPPQSLHGYSGPSALSANNKYAVLSLNGQSSIVEVATGKTVTSSPFFEGAFWHSKDDDILYYVGGISARSFNVRTGETTVLVDYSKTTPKYTGIRTGSRNDSSKDNWISFYAPAEHAICTLDLNTVKTYCATFEDKYNGVTIGYDNSASMMAKGIDSGTGKRYVVFAPYPTMVVFSVNMAAGKLDFEFFGPEVPDWGGNNNGICEPGERCLRMDHFDTFEDSKGIQYVFGALEAPAPEGELSLSSFQISTGTRMTTPVEVGGGRKHLMALFRYGEAFWTDWHAGCAKASPYCAVSTTYGDFQAQIDQTKPLPRGPHVAEVLVVRDNGREIRRLMKHRSVPLPGEEAQSYWTTPRAGMSSDGTYAFVDSNFGVANKQRTVLIETGYGKTRTRALLNGASFEASVSAGSIATVQGENLANCLFEAPEYPLPQTLCGTSVTVNNRLAPLYYVSPSQINFQIPQSATPGQKLDVAVARGSEADDTDTITAPDTAVGEASPAMFSYSLDDGVARAILQNADGSLNGPPATAAGTKPLQLGNIGVLYLTGLGPTAPAVADGAPAPVDPVASTATVPEVKVNDTPQQVLFAGLTPFFAGLYQINFLLDPGTPIQADNRIQVKVKDAQSPALAVSLAP